METASAETSPAALIRARILEREAELKSLEDQITRTEEFIAERQRFAGERRGQHLLTQGKLAELNELLKTFEPAPDAKASPEKPDETPALAS